MATGNFYFLALKPSLPEELETRALQAELLYSSQLEYLVKPIFLPLSFQFNSDEDGIFELGNALQKALNDIQSFVLTFNSIICNSTFKQLALQPELSPSLEVLNEKILNVLIDWNNFAHSPVTFELPKLEVALARGNWKLQEFEGIKLKALQLPIKQIWTIETVSMMEWTDLGWNEKFFFPLEDQRLLRKQSNTILQNK